jgi:hypothetical protein
VIHSPTLTKARATGEYCQQMARVSSTKPQTTVVRHRDATPPWIVSLSRIDFSSAFASAAR